MKRFISRLILTAILTLSALFITGCNPFEEYFDDSSNKTYYYATFKIDGVEKKFKSSSLRGFQFYDSSWNTGWGEKLDPYDDESGDVGDNFYLTLPSDVTLGSVYTQDDASHYIGSFMFDYFISDLPNAYEPDASENFTVTITEWNDEGGIIKGTFEGTLKNPYDLPATITITEGKFETINNGVDEDD
jgi:hypothetical protein